MSHVATVKVKVKDLDALRVAAESLGMELRVGQTTHRWYGKWVNDYHGEDAAFRHGIDPKTYGKCAHAVAVKGNASAYEIGLVAQPDGSYALAWDFFAGGYGLEKVAGKKCGNLVRAYVAEVNRKTLARQGYRVAGTRTLANGSVEYVYAK